MLTILEAIKNAENLESQLNENPPKSDLFNMTPCSVTAGRIAKMEPSKFAEVFDKKSIILYIPVMSISSMYGGKFKEVAKQKKGFGFYHFRDSDWSIVVISSISEEHCEVSDIELSAEAIDNKWWHQHTKEGKKSSKDSYQIPTEDIIDSFGALSLTKFKGYKIFVIDKEEFKLDPWKDNTIDTAEFSTFTLFSDFYELLDGMYKDYQKLYEDIYAIVSKGRSLDDIRSQKKGHTWNYAVCQAGPKIDYHKENGIAIAIVGFGKYFKIGKLGIGAASYWPSIQKGQTANISDFVSYSSIDKVPGFKITDKQYEKALEIAETWEGRFKKFRDEWNALIEKFKKKYD